MVGNEGRIYFTDRDVAGSCLRIVFVVEPADGFAQYGPVVGELLQETDLPAGRYNSNTVLSRHLVFDEMSYDGACAREALAGQVNIIDKKENYSAAIDS